MDKSLQVGKKQNGKPLTPEQQALCDDTAAKLKKLKRGLAQAVFHIGYLLVKVKESLDHGQFGRWLASEVGYSQRTAQNYMNAFRQLHDKRETVSHLPIKTIYNLATLPKDQCEGIVNLITDPANPPLAEIKKQIALQQAINRPDPQKRKGDKERAAYEKARTKELAAATAAEREAEEGRAGRDAIKEANRLRAIEECKRNFAVLSERWMAGLDRTTLREIDDALSSMDQHELFEAIRTALKALLTGPDKTGASGQQPSSGQTVESREAASTGTMDKLAA